MPRMTSISLTFSVEKLEEAMEEVSYGGAAVEVEAERRQVKGEGVSAMRKKSG